MIEDNNHHQHSDMCVVLLFSCFKRLSVCERQTKMKLEI